ncbi:hypothetical protein [Comamonas sp.]|uniref:hypothetical protein n=1 Tax=Comamonas sp. TaxID=34028 RepID=UPI002FCB2850
MTKMTQPADTGAQPAPALQPQALRIAMHLRQRANLSRPGNLDTLSTAGANELERQHAELSTVQSEAKHWRSNHDNVVARLRIFTQRPDIPQELADRLPWYRELVRLQEVEAQALQQSAEITDAEIDRIAESMPGGLDGFLKAWGWRQFARAILQAAPPAPAVAVPDERERFEAWARSYGTWEVKRDDCPALGTTGYTDVALTVAWHAVQARAALAASPAQEHATQLAGQKPRTPGSFVNTAGIHASDKPATVVRKLDAAFHDAVTFADTPAQAQDDARYALTQAARDVLDERARQVNAEGYEPEADDGYESAELAAAAATYALLATGADGWRVEGHWPWAMHSLKKTDPRRMLVKSVALSLAEIERLDRAAARAAQGGA